MFRKPIAKKIAVLLSKDNPIWHDSGKKTLHSGKVLGIKYGTLRKWINGDAKPRVEMIELICTTLNDEHGEGVLKKKQLEMKHFKDDYHVHDFASLFDIGRCQCNKIIDTEFYRDMPLLPGFYCSEGEVKSLFKDYKGLYTVYRKGLSENYSDDVFELRMHVRYEVPMAESSAIRVKLHVPDLEGSWYQYDGFLTVRGAMLYWVFESRTSAKRDFIWMITSGTEGAHDRGIYASVNKEAPRIPTARRVVLKREIKETEDETAHKFMYQKSQWFPKGDKAPPSIMKALRE